MTERAEEVLAGAGVGIGTPVLEVSGLSKSFGAEQALSNVDLRLPAGEIRALVGANGSGKSTIVKILAGFHDADDGLIRVDGEEVDPSRAGGLAGFRFVHQDLALIPELTVAENIAMADAMRELNSAAGKPSASRWIKPKSDRRQAAEIQPLIDSYDLDFRATDKLAQLSASDRTMVAVIRAFRRSEEPIKVLVLDEVTATLPPPEVERLFASIRRLPQSGVSVIFVSHRIEEVLSLCNSVTVLRDGRVVSEKAIADTSEHDLVQLITGKKPEALYPELTPSGQRPILELRGLAGVRLTDVSLDLHEGEIVGLASLDPTEASQLLRLIYGSESVEGGTLTLDGTEVPTSRNPSMMSDLGVSLVVDRIEGGIEALAVRENLTLNNVSAFFRGGRMRGRAERRSAKELIDGYQIKPGNTEAAFGTLSGGNQQKAVLAKSMRLEPRVLLLDDPTRGVDIGAKAVLFGIVRSAAEQGLAVLMTSTELEELCGVCHRVIVLKNGRTNGVIEGEDLTPHAVLERCYLGGGAPLTTTNGSAT